MDKHSVAILGAGITGLSTAYALKKRGIKVTDYEKNKKVGGGIQSCKKERWLTEKGPNTMLVRGQKLWDLFDELNLTNRIAEANKSAKKRFVVRDKKLHAVPTSLGGFLTTRLLSTAAKFRLLKEPFISPTTGDDETIADFVKRRFGNEPLDYGVNPFVAGIYAGNPEKLSIKHTLSKLCELEQRYGSITKGLLKNRSNNNTKKALISFDNGMQVLPNAFLQKLGKSVLLNAQIQEIEHTSAGWSVKVKKDNEEKYYTHSSIISTLPAHQLPQIWASSKSQQLIQKLAGIEYAPIRVVTLGFKKDQIDHPLDGFGMLLPEKEPFNILGCLFSSTLFPNRAPKGHILLTCFIGGTRNPEMTCLSTESATSKTLYDLNQLLGINGRPVFSHHTCWSRAIPQFNVGYDSYLKVLDKIEQENRGLFITGNFKSGVSVPDCILSAFEMARRIKQYCK